MQTALLARNVLGNVSRADRATPCYISTMTNVPDELLRYHTAVHEAGHAVMAHRLGIVVWCASIVPEDGTQGGTIDEAAGQSIGARVQVLLAGYAACVAAELPKPKTGCLEDFQRATWMLDLAADDLGSIEKWMSDMVAFMRERQNIDAVAAVAQQLLACGELQFDQLHACIEHADAS
jgi:ATP-dependent Zn protease